MSLLSFLCTVKFTYDSLHFSQTVCGNICSIDLTADSPATTRKPSEEADGKLSMITWNVDGLDTDNIAERARGLCSYLVL